MLIKTQKKINKKIAPCKNLTRSHIRLHKPHAISDQNGQNLFPILDHKGSKTIPFGAAHTNIAYIREYPPGHKPHPISDQNGQNLCPISDQKGSKTIPFGVAHTYIAYVREYPLPRVRYKFLVWNKTVEFCMLSGKLFHSS